MGSPNVNFFISYVDGTVKNSSKKINIKENMKLRDFYSSKQTFDYVDYINKGSKEKIDYISYSGNQEKSRGIFDKNGLMSKESIKQLRNELRKTKSVIWHGLISFTEEFGDNYCGNYEQAYELMKEEFPKFFDRAGLNKNNIIWFAGLHENTDNKHIHFSFFEKSPLRYQQKKKCRVFSEGYINNEAIRKTKVSIELKLLNSSKDIYDERKIITEKFKQLGNKEVMKQVKNLIIIIPKTGRLSYESENMKSFKKDIKNAINLIINNNKELQLHLQKIDKILTQHDEETIKIYKRMKIDYKDKLLKQKYVDDLYRRLGNLVLTTIKEIRDQQKKLEYSTKNRLILKRIEKNKRKILFRECERLNNLTTKEIINSFKEFLHKLDEMEYKRLQEENIAYEES